MAYDPELADRLRAVLVGTPGLREKRMFGGLGFMVNGHLAVSASGQGGLLLRIAPADYEALLHKPHVEPFEMRGREMSGWLHILEQAVPTEETLEEWVGHGLAYVRSLPPK
jgi:hypothetical protein